MMLTWTNEEPKKPGWYWMKWDTENPKPEEKTSPDNVTLAQVKFIWRPGPITPEMFGGGLEVFTIGNDAPTPLDEFGQGIQWAGPLEPPS